MTVRRPLYRPIGVVLWLLLVLILLLPEGVRALQAEPPSVDPIRISLDEALERARSHNPAFRRVRNDLALNALDRRDGWLDLLPTPQLNPLTTSLHWSRRTTAEDFFGEPVPRDVVEWVETSRSTQGFGLNMSLDFRDFLQRRQIEERATVRELFAAAGEQDLRADVARAFLEVQERRAVLEMEEELLRTASVNRDLARELFALGRVDRIDVLTLEIEAVERENLVEESRRGLESARHGLRSTIGDPSLEAFEIVPQDLGAFEPDALDLPRLVALAREHSPTVRQAQADVRLEEQSTSLVRAAWLPTINVFMNGQRQDFVRGSSAFLDPAPASGWDGSVGVTLSFPDLGQYFRRGVQHGRAEVAVANSHEALREVSSQVEQNVRTLFDELGSRARNLDVQERRRDLAAERLALAHEEYRLGNQTYLELQAAQEQAAEARRQLLAARFSLERARIELERGVGLEFHELVEPRGTP